MPERIFSGAPWEPQVGYCRAIRVGDSIHVSGTAPVDDEGGLFAPGDAYAQARRCIELALESLESFGPHVTVVRTRMFVTDISRWAEFGRAHKEFFGDAPPATSMVEVARLIDPGMLIEIEVEAVIAG